MENNAPPRANFNAFALNSPLVAAVAREGAAWAEERCQAVGALVGSEEGRFHADRSEAHPPLLHRYDRFGDRVDVVERDPSWHWLVDRSIEHDLHGLPWRDGAPAHAARAAMVLLWGELSLPGICPASGNYAMVPALRADPNLADKWIPRLLAPARPQLVFAAASLTERQGGSDVRSNRTTAHPIGGGQFLLNGLKWFVTCPWADILLVLAQAPGGLTCFLVESSSPVPEDVISSA